MISMAYLFIVFRTRQVFLSKGHNDVNLYYDDLNPLNMIMKYYFICQRANITYLKNMGSYL
jgi:hypothetical protein